MKKTILKTMLIVSLFAPSTVFASDKNLLVIVTSGDSVTQLMAMVLGVESKKAGADVSILLCGPAGVLAIKGADEVKLKPRDMSPQMLLNKLIEGGSRVELCPPYLPNSSYTKADLASGIAIAQPPEVTVRLLDDKTKILSY